MKGFRHPAEKISADHLADLGHRLIAHNFHARFAEIDLITIGPDDTIHVCEVKAWKTDSLIHPLEEFALNREKRIAAWKHFLGSPASVSRSKELKLELSDCSVSFDLICVDTSGRVEIHENI